ncbi:MAG: SseB family protein [bacterium]
MTLLDTTYAELMAGGDGLRFFRALADAELFLLLEAEAEGEVMMPRLFDLADGPVLLAFDSEDRLGAFSDVALPYAALPGRVIAGQMAGQGLSLGLNLGSGATSELILPPEALDWLMAMLDQSPPEALEAQVERFEPAKVPEAVLTALAGVLPGGRSLLVGVRYRDGRQGTLLALTGVAAEAEAKWARAVTEAMAFSGIEAAALDVVFVAAGDALLDRMSGVAMVFEGEVPVAAEPVTPVGPGMDPTRPPVLR